MTMSNSQNDRQLKARAWTSVMLRAAGLVAAVTRQLGDGSSAQLALMLACAGLPVDWFCDVLYRSVLPLTATGYKGSTSMSALGTIQTQTTCRQAC